MRRDQAPADSTEFSWHQKKHLQGTGACIPLNTIVSRLYLYCGEQTSIPFVGRQVSTTDSLLSGLLVAFGLNSRCTPGLQFPPFPM